MQTRSLLLAGTVRALCLLLISPAQTQDASKIPAHQENSVATHASGTFDVKVTPQPPTDFETSVGLARYSLDKELHGEIEGTSKGEMLATNTEVKGSAAYVALEKVTGTLNGRAGSFILQHAASMTSASQQMLITVVPDSGTGQFIGLTGKFIIKIVDKKHFYEFDYTLPPEN
jgi:hypothetical protein